MLFYSAGNFVLLSNQRREEEFKKMSEAIYGERSYCRLTSFFFSKETDIVMNVKKDSDG